MEDEAQDIWPVTGYGFTNVYPIKNRATSTGLFYVVANTFNESGDPDDPPWPPESATLWNGDGVVVENGKEFWHDYSDDIEGLGPGYLEYTDGVLAFISDGWGGATLQLFRRHNIHSGSGYQQKSAVNAQWINQFDLTGIDASQIQRAELVISMGGIIFLPEEGDESEPWNPVAQELVFRIDSDPLHEFDGWKPTWEDLVDLPSGSSVIPPITSHDVINWSSSVEPNPYLDPYAHPDYVWAANSAYPINAAGLDALRKGGVLNVRGGLTQDVIPAYGDFSNVFIEQIYSHWDAFVEADDILERGAFMPHLRLWLASDVYIAGEATISMAAEGALRPEQPEIVNHLARLRRDQR